jgi:hypothetical protein
MRNVFKFALAFCALSFLVLAPVVQAQDILTRGSIRGTVTDPNGAVVTGATVVVTGPTGERTTTTNSDGIFEVGNLTPGVYAVKITQPGFKSASIADATVYVGKATTVDTRLEVGESSAVVEVTAGAGIDQASTAVSTNLNDQLFESIPVARGVSGLFYLAPGTTNGLGGGKDNPSISGGSALDNLYVADGVNITDSGFGGIGTFSRSYGALGTGINTAFIKEVQVKTAGFEAQYGQSQGGIVNIITQSGGNEYHGAIYGYATPKAFEATALQADDFPRFNRGGKVLNNELYDVGADLGGYVPGYRERLFFFGSLNPSVRRVLVRGAEANALATTDSGLRIIRGEEFANRTTTWNYAFKFGVQVNPSHEVTFSIFGDPSETNKGSWRTLNTDNTTADSVLKYGTRNIALRYNGTWGPTMTFNASLGIGRTTFNETGFDDFNNIVDRRGSDALTIEGQTGGIGPAVGNFSAIGLGFFEPTLSRTKRGDFNFAKTASFWGEHTFGLGFTYQRGNYDGTRDRSGPHWTIPNLPQNGIAAGQTTNVQWRLRFRPATDTTAALFPVQLANGTTQMIPVRLQVIRAEFGVPTFTTFSDYHAAYVQDTWRFNRYVTGIFGLRWEQERLTGSPGPTGERIHYTFTGQWAPRLGVTVDPFGKGKTKAFYNFGRFFEFLPLDLAERSLSAEQDWTGTLFVPEFTVNAAGQRVAVVNQFGTVNPIVDAAHQLPGDATISTGDPANPIVPGTKLGYTDEHTFGIEQQLPWNLVLSARYIDRKSKRIIEDAASVSPEAALAGVGQVYYIGNVSSTLDAAVNLVPFLYTTGGAIPAGCAQTGGVPDFFFDSANNQSVCFAQTGIDADHNAINQPDGIPDGFPDPIRKYRAVEIELNKRFSNNWQAFFNWRIAKLEGNFEGHLRNDNGQTDPGISSLFDFTAGDLGLLGDQFAVGPLNSDRRHIINAYGSYNFGGDNGLRLLKGLNLGANVHFETGLPINRLDPHPVYLNTGEIPLGGRGSLGRTENYWRFDAHVDYAWALSEKTRLKFVADFFNVFNKQTVLRPDENSALDFNAALGTNPPNQDFLKPRPTLGIISQGYHPPFNMRLGVRFEW